jgi:hypothetical protein
MGVLPLLACAAPILTLPSVGVSWAIAGVVRVCHHLPFWSVASDSRRGSESALAPNTSNNRSPPPDGLPTNNSRARRAFGLTRQGAAPYEKVRGTIVELARVRITAAGRNALAAED